MTARGLLDGRFEVRTDDTGGFDELVSVGENRCHVHFEMLSDNQLWVGLMPEDGDGEVHVVITSRGKLTVTTEEA